MAKTSRSGQELVPEGPVEEPESTRERILDIALELFIEHGYDKTSLRQIAERLGFTKAAIYYHFASKEDILMALHMRLHEFGSDALAVVDSLPVTPKQWLTILDELIEQVIGHRQLFVLHERNRAAVELLHRQPHQEAHEDLEIIFRRVLANRELAARDRVRMAASVGAVMFALLLSENVFADVSDAELGALVRDAARDLLDTDR